jgi:hypothetical protein
VDSYHSFFQKSGCGECLKTKIANFTAAPNNNDIMRLDDILDFSTSKSSSIFETYREKNQKQFNIFLKLSAVAIFFLLGIIFIVPTDKLERTLYFPILILVCGAIMLITTFFRFLITHHERNIATAEKQILAPTHDGAQTFLHLFLSIFVAAVTISRTNIILDNCIDYFNWSNNKLALSFFAVIWSGIAIFFVCLAFKGAYHWALHLDQKIRKAKNYDARVDVILFRFLGFLFTSILSALLIGLIYSLVLNITNGHSRGISTFILVGFFINFLIYGAFSLFLLIHTIRNKKEKRVSK